MAFTGSFYFPQIQKGTHKSHSPLAADYGLLYADIIDAVSPAHKPYHKGTSASGNGSGETPNFDEYGSSNYIGILDTDLTVLTNGQKNFFIITVTILCCLSILGNVSTLVVNVRRKIRPFFRACLISLALSDLVNSMFLSSAYLSQFSVQYVQTWLLGSVMCNLVPFATTAAILASSMTLVGIAVDRYYAVMKALIGFWNPTEISCIVCMLCIWLAAIGIASPVFTIYVLQPVAILTQDEQTNGSVASLMATTTLPEAGEDGRAKNTSGAANETVTTWEAEASQVDLHYTLIEEEALVDMCISEREDVTLYYIIVFIIVFLPCIGAFFWFNIIIARNLWQRRRCVTATSCTSKDKLKCIPVELRKSQIHHGNDLKPPPLRTSNLGLGHNSSSGITIATVDSSTSHATSATACNAVKQNSREARHLRMFTIILLMMAVFVFLRLPAWVFLLMRLYGSYNKPIHWILYFVFGLMNLTSSVLNPLFFTFLTETIEYTLRVKARVTTLVCGSCTMCCKKEIAEKPRNTLPNTIPKGRNPQFLFNCCENFSDCGEIVRALWQCFKIGVEQRKETVSGNDDICAKDSSERDEGVDCSEEVEEDTKTFNIYNHRIYTIYPESLVSSSVNSY